MTMQENVCSEGIERRGRNYYMRIRVPVRYALVEARSEISRSLKTRDFDEAKARSIVARRAILSEWDARLAGRKGKDTPEAFDAAVAMLTGMGMSYRPMEELLAGPIHDLLDRIEALETAAMSSARIPAALGALEFPQVNISGMPQIIEEISRASISAKNGRQLGEWRNKYTHAAASFVSVTSDKPVMEITEQDAVTYHSHWKSRRDNGEITTNHAVKRVRFIRQLVDAYYERFSVPGSVAQIA